MMPAHKSDHPTIHPVSIISHSLFHQMDRCMDERCWMLCFNCCFHGSTISGKINITVFSWPAACRCSQLVPSGWACNNESKDDSTWCKKSISQKFELSYLVVCVRLPQLSTTWCEKWGEQTFDFVPPLSLSVCFDHSILNVCISLCLALRWKAVLTLSLFCIPLQSWWIMAA